MQGQGGWLSANSASDVLSGDEKMVQASGYAHRTGKAGRALTMMKVHELLSSSGELWCHTVSGQWEVGALPWIPSLRLKIFDPSLPHRAVPKRP